MKILVVGSNGNAGGRIAKLLSSRGHEVVGLGKSENKGNVKNYIKKDATLLTFKDVENFDVVVDAVGGWTKDTIPYITKAMNHLASILEKTDIKLYVVGGAGSLFTNKEKTLTVDMGPSFPESWKPLSSAHGEGLKTLRNSKSLNWVYVSPACNFVVDGENTNGYILGGDNLILNSKGESTISYDDYALAFVDVIEENKYNKERISVVSK